MFFLLICIFPRAGASTKPVRDSFLLMCIHQNCSSPFGQFVCFSFFFFPGAGGWGGGLVAAGKAAVGEQSANLYSYSCTPAQHQRLKSREPHPFCLHATDAERQCRREDMDASSLSACPPLLHQLFFCPD